MRIHPRMRIQRPPHQTRRATESYWSEENVKYKHVKIHQKKLGNPQKQWNKHYKLHTQF